MQKRASLWKCCDTKLCRRTKIITIKQAEEGRAGKNSTERQGDWIYQAKVFHHLNGKILKPTMPFCRIFCPIRKRPPWQQCFWYKEVDRAAFKLTSREQLMTIGEYQEEYMPKGKTSQVKSMASGQNWTTGIWELNSSPLKGSKNLWVNGRRKGHPEVRRRVRWGGFRMLLWSSTLCLFFLKS